MRKLFYVLTLLLASLELEAQRISSDYERLLVPIYISPDEPLRSAFGNAFVTDFFVRNLSDEFVPLFESDGICYSTGCEPDFVSGVQPERTQSQMATRPRVGNLLRAKKTDVDKLAFSLRLVHVPVATDAGTEIPIVRERGLFTGPAVFVDVPVHDGFRHMLRLYDADSRAFAYVQIRIFTLDGDVPIVEETLELRGEADEWPFSPGYSEIPELPTRYPELKNYQRVRIEILPLTPGLRFWGMISISNHEKITIVTPGH